MSSSFGRPGGPMHDGSLVLAVIKDLGPLRIDHHVFGFTDVDTDLAGGLCAVGIEIVQRVLRLSQVGVARCSVVGEAQACM